MHNLYFESPILTLMFCIGLCPSFSSKSKEGNPEPVKPRDATYLNVKSVISCWHTIRDKPALKQKQDPKLVLNTAVNQDPAIKGILLRAIRKVLIVFDSCGDQQPLTLVLMNVQLLLHQVVVL